MMAYSRYAARRVNDSWCYCAMGYDADGVYTIVAVLVSGYSSREDVYDAELRRRSPLADLLIEAVEV